jgi:tripartite-type tricarboxylate transporter receptor subunit TctC
MKRQTFLRGLAALHGAALLAPLSVRAQDAQSWPQRPVKLIVPYPPGASTDAVSREVARQMSVFLGQQVIVDNRPGAGGLNGSSEVSRSAPDGYTLQLGTNATHGLAQLMTRRKLYDPIKDFTPLTPVAMMPLALAAHPSVPAGNAAELVRYAKANPGKLSYATAGQGSPHHIAGEVLSQLAGGGLVHVPYKGTGQAMTDLLGGQVPLAFSSLSAALPYAQSGKLKILGMVESERSRGAPQIPTIGESLPGYAIPATWLGFFAPPGMPDALASRIHDEMVKAIQAPAVSDRINGSGLQVITSSREDFVRRMRDDTDRFRNLIAITGIQPE